MGQSNSNNVTKLQLIAAMAKDAAEKLERGQYWEGELAKDIQRIRQALEEIKT